MQKSVLYKFILPCLMALLASCGHNDEPPAPEPPTPVDPEEPELNTHRTVLVYMLADNNLGWTNQFDRLDMSEMLDGVKGGNLNGGRLLVYYNRPYTAQGNTPQLIEITPDGQEVLKTYPDDPSLYSVEISRMREVIADMKTTAEADDYGIIFWGHATAWMTHDEDMDQKPTARSYGNDRDQWMSLSSLGEALEGEKFSFVYFDCCLMGTIEIAYELKDITPVIVGSPTEVEGEGMPYNLNIPAFFTTGTPDVIQAAKNTYEYYKDRPPLFGQPYCSQMVVVNTSCLPDLAEKSRALFSTLDSYPDGLNKIQAFSQPFNPLDATYRDTRPVYDMEQYMQLIGADHQELLAQWQEAFDSCILYKATTATEFTGIEIKTYGGLGSFIIKKAADAEYRGYKQTKWWTDVVSAAPLFN